MVAADTPRDSQRSPRAFWSEKPIHRSRSSGTRLSRSGFYHFCRMHRVCHDACSEAIQRGGPTEDPALPWMASLHAQGWLSGAEPVSLECTSDEVGWQRETLSGLHQRQRQPRDHGPGHEMVAAGESCGHDPGGHCLSSPVGNRGSAAPQECYGNARLHGYYFEYCFRCA